MALFAFWCLRHKFKVWSLRTRVSRAEDRRLERSQPRMRTPGHRDMSPEGRGQRLPTRGRGVGADLTEDIGATSTWVLSFISCSKMFYLMHNMTVSGNLGL